MDFDRLDRRMRVHETLNDARVLPGMHVVARIDGRSFTRLTREVHRFEAPFDARFRDMMIETVRHLMGSGFRVTLGYTQSDEISLLLAHDEDLFGRKERKLLSVLAGEASARFSVELGAPAAFDCRLCLFPNADLVVDYFRWRSEDAHRNALNGHCYWALRGTGLDAREATARLRGLSVADKNELLHRVSGTNFNDVPAWQRRGVVLRHGSTSVAGRDPRTGGATVAERRTIEVDLSPPMREGFSALVRELLGETGSGAEPEAGPAPG